MSERSQDFLSAAERAAVDLRHAMHREPELSNAEWKTQKRIMDLLRDLCLQGMRTFHRTDVYLDIEGRASGPKRSIAVRGDMDSLPGPAVVNDAAMVTRFRDIVRETIGPDAFTDARQEEETTISALCKQGSIALCLVRQPRARQRILHPHADIRRVGRPPRSDDGTHCPLLPRPLESLTPRQLPRTGTN